MIKELTTGCAILALAGCSPADPDSAEALRRNMARWEARGPSSYQVVLQRSTCECLPEWLVPIRLTIRNREIESVVNVESGDTVSIELYHAMTVEELFSVVDDALDQNAHRVSVTYDAALGYPQSIFIDYDRDMVDGELHITARDLIPVE
jgi:hypothetical protein